MAGPAKKPAYQSEEQRTQARLAREEAELERQHRKEREALRQKREQSVSQLNTRFPPVPSASPGGYGQQRYTAALSSSLATRITSTAFTTPNRLDGETSTTPTTTSIRSYTTEESKPEWFTKPIPAGTEIITISDDDEPTPTRSVRKDPFVVKPVTPSKLPFKPNDAGPVHSPQRSATEKKNKFGFKPKATDQLAKKANSRPNTTISRKPVTIPSVDDAIPSVEKPEPKVNSRYGEKDTAEKSSLGFSNDRGHIANIPKSQQRIFRPADSDTETQVSAATLREQNNDRSSTLKNVQKLIQSPSIVAAQNEWKRLKKESASQTGILHSDRPGSRSPERNRIEKDGSEDVEMQDAFQEVLECGKKSLILKLKFINKKAFVRHLNAITARSPPASVLGAVLSRSGMPHGTPTPASSASREPTLAPLENDELPWMPGAFPTSTQESTLFKMPGLPASATPQALVTHTKAVRKRPVVSDTDEEDAESAGDRTARHGTVFTDIEDDEFDPEQDIDPEKWRPKQNPKPKSPTNSLSKATTLDEMDIDEDEDQPSEEGVRKQFGLRTREVQPQARSDSDSTITMRQPSTTRSRLSFLSSMSTKEPVPRGVRASMNGEPTPSELGSPSRKRLRPVDGDDEDFVPGRDDSHDDVEVTYMRVPFPKPGRHKRSKYASDAPVQEIQKPRPRTPTPKSTPKSTPVTPGAPRPNRFKDTNGKISPVTPIRFNGFHPVSPDSPRTSKRRAAAKAAQGFKKIALMERLPEEEHFEALGAQVLEKQSKRKSEEANILQSIERDVSDMSLTPVRTRSKDTATEYTFEDACRDRIQKGDRYQMRGVTFDSTEQLAADGAPIIYGEIDDEEEILT